jgi:hypothetical protein
VGGRGGGGAGEGRNGKKKKEKKKKRKKKKKKKKKEENRYDDSWPSDAADQAECDVFFFSLPFFTQVRYPETRTPRRGWIRFP